MDKDLISRKDIIKTMNLSEGEASKHTFYSAEWILNCINSIPSIATKSKYGEWIDVSEWYTPRQKCSICKTVVDGYGSNFCPNCGADMREREGE